MLLVSKHKFVFEMGSYSSILSVTWNNISRVERKTGVSQMVVFPQT